MVSLKTAPAWALVLACTLCGQSLTQSERSKAVSELERTRDLLLSATANVSEDKAKLKPGPNRWSVLDCVEHLAVTEVAILGLIQGNFKAPPSSDADRAKTMGVSMVDVFATLQVYLGSLYVNDFNTGARRSYAKVGFGPAGTFASVLF